MDKKFSGKTAWPVTYPVFLSGLIFYCFFISVSSAQEAKQKSTDKKIFSKEEKVKEGKMTESNKLTDQEGKYLIEVARKTIEQELSGVKAENNEGEMVSPKFSEKRGTFVTLIIHKNLRGCIGYITPPGTILEGIKQNAISAAFSDTRFNPLSKKEWGDVKIEISILTSPTPLDYSDADDLLKKIRPDIDGVIIRKGYYNATFLPQVWEQVPDKKEFFTHLCLKAGMDGNEWKKGKLEVYTYQVQAFEED
jgi:AmmeMemoRadiSam system protein A